MKELLLNPESIDINQGILQLHTGTSITYKWRSPTGQQIEP